MIKPMKIGEAKMMNGKTKMNDTFKEIFEKQTQNQMRMISKGMYDEDVEAGDLPCDNIKLVSYHVLQLMSELGEVLDADKRWKNFRNKKYDKEAKLEEIADCFIVLMNIAMFSGFNGSDVENAVNAKIEEVKNRINA